MAGYPEDFVPNADEFKWAYCLYMEAVADVARIRSNSNKVEGLGRATEQLYEEFGHRIADYSEFGLHYEDLQATSLAVLCTLYQEMVYGRAVFASYIAKYYPERRGQAWPDKFAEESYIDVHIDPMSEKAVDAIETINDSILEILDRLPWWLQKIMKALMEMVKLSRGGG